MMNRTTRKRRWLPVALLALASSIGPAFAQQTVVNLKVGTTDVMMPDGQVIPMWGYGWAGAGNPITVPGPDIVITSDSTSLRVNLTNELATGTAVSIIIPGLGMPVAEGAVGPTVARNPDGRIRSFTHEATAGATVAYIFNNVKPGTYLYHSGTHPAVQVQMGLYGAVKMDAANGEAYAGVPYDAEVQLLYSEIDPALHEVVDAGTYGTSMTSTIDYNPQYFLVNGQPYSSTTAVVSQVTAGQTVLVRLLNAGLEAHTPVFQGLRVSAIAEDGNLYPTAKDLYAVLLAAGKTRDVLVSPPVGTYPIYDHSLYLTNGAASPGGLLSYLQAQP
jgi:FtsP/CotA-like multicopper oxidase with cupredoxin domain